MEPFYTKFGTSYQNPEFHKFFSEKVIDACLYYIDEPGLSAEEREMKFRESMEEAYSILQNIK